MSRHHRLHVPPDRIVDDAARLLPDEAGYLRRVLRLSPEDAVEVFDGRGRTWQGRVVALTEEGGEVALGEAREGLTVDRPFVLLQGLAKGEKMELVIQKATELGVTEILPVACARSVVKLDAAKAAKRTERWRRIAAEAARQCGRADVPEVHPPAPLAEAAREVGSRPDLACMIAWVGAEDRGLADFVRAEGHRPGHALLVGPEGGFAGDEVAAAREAGFTPVRLGRRILRTETVALAVLAAVRFAQGDLG